MFHVEHHAAWWDVLVAGCLKLGISVDETVFTGFSIYLRELRSWNRKINLSGFEDPGEIAVKHFLDSLVGAKILKGEAGESALDIGSGAGFPGLPLKILYPPLSLHLLEPSSKKTAFLRHMIGTLGLKHVSVVSKRVQDLASEPTQKDHYQYVLTRAVNLDHVLLLVPSLLADTGKVILWRTRPLASKLIPPGLRQTGELLYSLKQGYGERRLVILEKQ